MTTIADVARQIDLAFGVAQTECMDDIGIKDTDQRGGSLTVALDSGEIFVVCVQKA